MYIGYGLGSVSCSSYDNRGVRVHWLRSWECFLLLASPGIEPFNPSVKLYTCWSFPLVNADPSLMRSKLGLRVPKRVWPVLGPPVTVVVDAGAMLPAVLTAVLTAVADYTCLRQGQHAVAQLATRPRLEARPSPIDSKEGLQVHRGRSLLIIGSSGY